MSKNKRDLVDVLGIADGELAKIVGGATAVPSDGGVGGPSVTPIAKSTLPGGGQTGDPTAASFEYGDELEDSVAVG